MLTRACAKLIFFPTIRWHIIGAGRARVPGPWLLASNHISHFDPPLLGAMIKRKVDWMAMAELFVHPGAAAFFRSIDTFPVDRFQTDRGAIRTALARLEQGRIVGMFPEGGLRSGAGSVLNGAPIRKGVGTLAHLANVPILPCVILGSDRLYHWKAWLPWKRTTIWIALGSPIAADHREPNRHAAREKLEAELAEAICALYRDLRERFSIRDEDLPVSAQRRKGRA